MRAPKWLENAVFYEIYPQSFYDSNNDGIGDIKGIELKLDYIKSLGCNAIWINPCFDSPFKDAGYDVRDYKLVAPRYGTNEDLYHMVKVAHQKGIRVLLDLVPCHTSEEHPWFKKSCEEDENEYSDRYIWTDNAMDKGNGSTTMVGGEAPRNGCYGISYFNCQPCLNYGYYKVSAPWQHAIDSPASLKTQAAIIDVIKFWLSHGVDGFRVDMAACMVREDEDEKGVMHIWENIFKDVKKDYPESAFVSEWSTPERSIKCGFDMDFTLDHGWAGGNGYHHLLRNQTVDKLGNILSDDSYFKWNNNKSPMRFIDEYLNSYNETKDLGYICFLTDNHDMPRIRRYYSIEELKLIYAFLFTMPGCPFLYYGDEIGMNYLKVRTKEGGYHRTGSRTPMQWDNSLNKGFSKADPKDLYLPVDDSVDAPDVLSQEQDKNSLLNFVREVISLRNKDEDLKSLNNFKLIYANENSKLLIYQRGKFIFFVNPSNNIYKTQIVSNSEVLQRFWGLNGDISIKNGEIIVPERSFNIYKM